MAKERVAIGIYKAGKGNYDVHVSKHVKPLLDLAYRYEIVHRNVATSAAAIKPTPYEAILSTTGGGRTSRASESVVLRCQLRPSTVRR